MEITSTTNSFQKNKWSECLIPDSALIEKNVVFVSRVVLADSGVVIRSGARLDTACVIAENVTIGQGSWVRAGSVVLQSVPANAIVEGNPARVVGYINQDSITNRPTPKLFDFLSIGEISRPAKIKTGVGDSAIYFMRNVVDARGALTVGEVPSEVPFNPVRYFVVYDVPSVELRGEHAHKQCEQFLICLHGSCRVLLDDGLQRCEVLLDRPDMGVYMPAMIWGTQYRYSSDAVLLVFASRRYEADDYLRTYDSFLAECSKHNQLEVK